MNTDNARGILLMTLAMALFTLNDTLIKAVMLSLPLFQAIALRGVMVCLVLVVILALQTKGAWGLRAWTKGPRDQMIIFARMFCDLAATVAFLTALHHMPLADLSAILQTLPLMMTLAAVVVYKESLGWRRLSAILIGLLGVLLVLKPGSDAFNIWALWGLLSVAIVCLRDLLTRQISPQVSSTYIALITGAGAMVMGFAGYPFEIWQPVSAQTFLYLALGAVVLAIALIVVVGAMRSGDVGAVAPFRYTALLWAIILGYLFFGEWPDTWGFVGITLIIGSGIFTLWREANLRQRAKV